MNATAYHAEPADNTDPVSVALVVLLPASEPDCPAASGDLVPLAIEVDVDRVLGGRDWQPELNLFLDQDGTASLRATERSSFDRGTLTTVWHGRDQEWTHRYCTGSQVVPDANQIADMAQRLRPLLDRVHLGRDIQWDGRNLTGTLNEDAEAASRAISDIMEEAWDDISATIRNAEDWL